MLIGHLEAFSRVADYGELSRNIGHAQFLLLNAMGQVLSETWDKEKEGFDEPR